MSESQPRKAKRWPDGWHTRGYLPHFDGGEIPQFVTFRLFDSLPQSVLARWRQELAQENESQRASALRRRAEAYLDSGYGACYLKDARVATLVQDALLFHHGAKYTLAAWVVMPNHVHLLATPRAGHELSGIMHSLKSYTASEANKILSRQGRFWQKESFDRYIRDAKHFHSVVAYIENNPVKAGLCEKPEGWPYGSAYFRARSPEI